MSKQILPDYIVRQDAVQAKVEEAKAMIESANNHLEALKKEDIPTQLEVLKNILKSDEAFKEWLDKAEKSYIGKMGFVPKEEKGRVHQSFVDVMTRTDSTRNILHGFIWNKYGYEAMQDKDGHLTFNLEKIEADATESAKKYFSQEDKEYFDLLQGVVEAYDKVRTFEKAHDYVPYSNRESFMQNLKGGFSPYWFAFSWEIGKMSKQGKEMLEELENE
jgi:hypothetical protein